MSLAFYAWRVIHSLPLERLQVEVGARGQNTYTQTRFESGSAVELHSLQTFYLMSEEASRTSFAGWLAQKKQAAKIEVKGQHVEILQTFSLPSLRSNDCSFRCLQLRISFDEIPSIFWRGLIGIEDYRFLDHFGVDWRAILRALWVDIRHRRMVQGGSTLTQQLAKNLFFSNEKTIRRKINEAIAAIYIEANYPKESILEAYFNEVYWGAFQGVQIKGLHAASLAYFNKTPRQLDAYQVSILVALLRGPHFYHPTQQTQRLKNRTDFVYQRLVELGLYPDDEGVMWSQQDWQQWIEFIEMRSSLRDILSLWQLLNGPAAIQGDKDFRFYQFILSANRQLHYLRSTWPEVFENRELALKVLALDYESGENVFTFSNREYEDAPTLFVKQRHQTGSLIKPLLYHLYFQHGVTANDKVETGEIELSLLSGQWRPREVSRVDHSLVRVDQALQRSLNRPVIHLAQQIGFQKIEEELLNWLPRLLLPLQEYPAQLLGAYEMSLSEVAQLYRQLIGKELEGEAQMLRLLLDPKKTTLRRAIGRPLQNYSFFAKTGTSNQGHDSWVVVFDGRYLMVVWLGLLDGRMEHSAPLFGSSAAFPVINNYWPYNGKRLNDIFMLLPP